jgi:hypothetical protein
VVHAGGCALAWLGGRLPAANKIGISELVTKGAFSSLTLKLATLVVTTAGSSEARERDDESMWNVNRTHLLQLLPKFTALPPAAAAAPAGAAAQPPPRRRRRSAHCRAAPNHRG